jgi:hypothetical protein
VCDTAALRPYIGSSDDAAAVDGGLHVRGLVRLGGDASLRPRIIRGIELALNALPALTASMEA